MQHPLVYLKAVIAAVGANVVPPLADWLVSILSKAAALTFIGALPSTVQTALSVLITALVTGGAVYAAPNRPGV